jgi:ribosome biogenesis GTPase
MSKSKKTGGKSGGASGKPTGGKGGRKVRVDMRKNMSAKAREKSAWTRGYHEHEYKTTDTESGESVRAKGALSRKRTMIEGDAAESENRLSGVVIATRGTMADVDCDGAIHRCTIRRMLRSRLTGERGRLTVGDRVAITPVEKHSVDSDEGGVADTAIEREGVIEDVAERTTTLTRQYKERVHVIAANVDQAVIVASTLDPEIRPHLIDRFLVAVHAGGMRPIICVNKIDIALGADGQAFILDVVERYRELEYTVIPTSTTEGVGIDALRDELRGKTSVVVGMSGVGKSSLLNAIQPGLGRRTGDVSESSGRGQHTTTTAELVRLHCGGYVVDTPGIRQYELAHVEANELEAYFPEFVGLIPQCRFPDCKHLTEVDCAVRGASEAGDIHPARYESYTRMVTQHLADEQTY